MGRDPDTPRPPMDAPEPDWPREAPGADLAMLLTGDLPCIGCGYDLRGLSVLAPCPECGIAVRATVLHRVDPQAEALMPMPTPWFTSLGLLAWTAAGFAAALTLWLPRLSDVLEDFSSGRLHLDDGWSAPLAGALVAVSALGMLGMIRPVTGLPRRRTAGALLGLLFYAPLLWSIHQVATLDRGLTPYLVSDPSPERLGWRLTASASLAAVLLLIRPNARELVKRSLVLRTKRVDRQTIYATLGALGVTVVGDLLRLAASLGYAPAEWANWVGTMLVLVGSVLVTMALAGATLDGWRIAHSILAPNPSPAQALRRAGTHRDPAP